MKITIEYQPTRKRWKYFISEINKTGYASSFETAARLIQSYLPQ